MIAIEIGDEARAYPLSILTFLSSMLISLGEFIETYPQGLVLSTETGHHMEYGTNPYSGYDDPGNRQPRLYTGKVDPRLPAMERVIDIHVNGKYKIYPLSVIRSKEVINDHFEGQEIVLFHTEIGSVTVFRPVVHGNHFALAWFAFHPDTEIYSE